MLTVSWLWVDCELTVCWLYVLTVCWLSAQKVAFFKTPAQAFCFFFVLLLVSPLMSRRRVHGKSTRAKPPRTTLIRFALEEPENEASCQSAYLVSLPYIRPAVMWLIHRTIDPPIKQSFICAHQGLHPNTMLGPQLMYEILHHLSKLSLPLDSRPPCTPQV